jgi:hypothetical protein
MNEALASKRGQGGSLITANSEETSKFSPHDGLCVLKDSFWMRGSPEIVLELPAESGGLNGSMQHWLGVYQREFQSLKFFAGVDSVVRLLCRDRLENSRIS